MVPMLAAVAPIVSRIVGSLFPDKDARAKAEAEAMKLLIENQHELEMASAKVITTEAASQHWLAANWRPLTMCVFVCLIVARWFGFAAPDLSEAEYLKLWAIVELGLGGYVIGRTMEKLAPGVLDTLKGKK